MEKKLNDDTEMNVGMTDEEIVKALEEEYQDYHRHRRMWADFFDGELLKNATDLIHRLQDENARLKKQIEELPKPRKKILANKVYSNSTLKKWSKEELIEQIRILEHNWECAEQSLANSVKNGEKIFYEQKAEIERLTELQSRGAYRVAELGIKNTELQKQVDELKKENYELSKRLVDEFEKFKVVAYEKVHKKAVKDTAKEILQGLESMANNGVYQGKLTVPQMRLFFKEQYGVEVK